MTTGRKIKAPPLRRSSGLMRLWPLSLLLFSGKCHADPGQQWKGLKGRRVVGIYLGSKYRVRMVKQCSPRKRILLPTAHRLAKRLEAFDSIVEIGSIGVSVSPKQFSHYLQGSIELV